MEFCTLIEDLSGPNTIHDSERKSIYLSEFKHKEKLQYRYKYDLAVLRGRQGFARTA